MGKAQNFKSRQNFQYALSSDFFSFYKNYPHSVREILFLEFKRANSQSAIEEIISKLSKEDRFVLNYFYIFFKNDYENKPKMSGKLATMSIGLAGCSLILNMLKTQDIMIKSI